MWGFWCRMVGRIEVGLGFWYWVSGGMVTGRGSRLGGGETQAGLEKPPTEPKNHAGWGVMLNQTHFLSDFLETNIYFYLVFNYKKSMCLF